MIGPGSRLAHYEVVSALGKGGMGEVWRAMDTKLGREVAIKTLPPEFAEDPDRLARFEREARLLASLNHPNIAAIYGLEEHEGSRFLALELVEGDTLGDRLQGGAIPVDESLKLAQQIAEAVEAAHEKGVIHRDLKPANIKVTEDGQIKILDFGLAKAFASEETEVNVSNSPTLSMAATQQGLILGTAAYMSPEQAKGRPVDERTDVWAFGCVLYEMLTGRSVFEGEDAADILGAVLAKDVNWDPLPSNLHPRVRELLERCLARQQKNRYRGISDARVDIERILADPGGAVVPPAAEKVHRTSRPKLLWGGAVVLAVVAGVVGWSLKPDSPRPGRVVRFAQLLPEGQQLTDTSRNVVAVSPDGSRMVYAADLQLYVRDMDALEAAPISGTADPFPANPFISPDGTWVGFWSGGDQQLKRIPMDGAAPVTIAEMPNNSYGAPSWGDDDTIVWARAEGIMRFSAGAPPDLMIPNEVEGELLTWPQILPDGDSVLFAVVSDRDATEGETVVQSLESGDRKILFGGTHPRYVSTGHVVYVAGNILFAVPFDVDRLEVTGDPVVLAADIQTGPVQYDVSDSGALVYVPAVSRGNVLLWMDRNGNPEPIDTIPRGDYDDGVRLSPDGGRVLVTRNGDRWIYDIASGRESRITRDGMGVGGYAEWDPTGTRIAHTSRRGGDLGSVWIESIDGAVSHGK